MGAQPLTAEPAAAGPNGTGESAGSRRSLSIVSGPPLGDEPGLGALTLPGFLREVTARYGEREALVARPAGAGADAAAAVRWTYSELWERAVEVASALRACGVGKDSRVGVLMTNRPEWISAVFGISLAGGVAVALSTFSTRSELDDLLRISGASVLLLERSVLKKDFAAVLTELEPEIARAEPGALESARFPFLRRVVVLGDGGPTGAIETWEDFLARGRDEPRELVEATGAAVQPSDTALLFFSSGTTSRPKGILNSHRGVAIQLWRFRRMYRFDPEDHIRCWTANGFFWSGNFGMALGATFASGGSVVLQPTFLPAEALELMDAEKVNFPFAWPHQWAQLEAAPNWKDVDLSSMRFADVRSAIARHPTVSARWEEPGHAYGNTETFTLTTGLPADTPPERHRDSSGEALPGVTLKIVDPLTGVVVPRGEQGEICVKGPTLMLGYVGTPLDETLDAEGFFRTGDGGYLDHDDLLFWKGRLTDIIKTGGANVSPREVDETLASYTGVKLAQTVGVPHETLGEMVVSCIVPHEGVTLDAEEIRGFLRERLASYKVPRRVLFFREEDIAVTGSAKIKSADLRALAASRLAGETAPAPA
ncbi:AMP-dependent synthetase and ligase [Frankia sp. Hr75.2]|uniref:class I adenylate-forming enzyme family protein n=1 Tax=Parafrankia sp. Ea1.12 TaxID=573499 RepID=UPI000DA4A463|nr:class I adenylate-forming enzyme family protein [Parafrankia sp. Ea1.12]CAI7974053.1 AMP-dependent synthetase and ligase [Frankia sp. Hr75.2]SQE00208.1 AMP-dependent synthetase and ligase [Parafrankia sp. Ea1.12]